MERGSSIAAHARKPLPSISTLRPASEIRLSLRSEGWGRGRETDPKAFIAGIVPQSIPAILSQIFLSESLVPEWGRVILYLRGVQWVLLPSV